MMNEDIEEKQKSKEESKVRFLSDFNEDEQNTKPIDLCST
jgi:hypothetical protein